MCSAGSKDSVLTSHGVLQINHLASHFARKGVQFTHIFSSDLQRAFNTANAILSKQGRQENLQIAKLEVLREQDFGSLEGKSYERRPRDFKIGGEPGLAELEAKSPSFRPVESKESLTSRVDNFLNEHLMPIIKSKGEVDTNIAVVSHGMTLNRLWRRLQVRVPGDLIKFAPNAIAPGKPMNLELTRRWSNTGYLELQFLPLESNATIESGIEEVVKEGIEDFEAVEKLKGWMILIRSVDNRAHLQGVKRTRGGVGSSAHDEKQKTMESFFTKRQKVE